MLARLYPVPRRLLPVVGHVPAITVTFNVLVLKPSPRVSTDPLVEPIEPAVRFKVFLTAKLWLIMTPGLAPEVLLIPKPIVLPVPWSVVPVIAHVPVPDIVCCE